MTSILKPLSTALLGGLLLSGCVLDEDSDGYTIDVQVADAVKGVAEVTVTVSGDGVIEGQSINVTPHMKMVSGMEHGTPFSENEGELDANGQFKTTAYFLMPSAMGDTKMGDWSINVEYNDITENFPITVEMMGTDKKNLVGTLADDAISHMGADVARPYYIYDLGRMTMNNMNQFSVYITARETLFDYNPIAVGETLTGGATDLGITAVTVEMCSADDCESNNASWKNAMPDTTVLGKYTAMDLGLHGDDTDEVQVRLTVNDIIKKTSDDMDHVTFTFSAMNMSGM